jgi:hypothetical protein
MEGTAAMGMALAPARFQWSQPMPIRAYLGRHAAFEPEAIEAVSKALEKACTALHIDGEIKDRKIVATRIIDLARSGVINPETLSARVIAEVRAMRSL